MRTAGTLRALAALFLAPTRMANAWRLLLAGREGYAAAAITAREGTTLQPFYRGKTLQPSMGRRAHRPSFALAPWEGKTLQPFIWGKIRQPQVGVEGQGVPD